MNLELLTKNDLQQLKQEILDEIRVCLSVKNFENEWLKSSEVRLLLKCSNGTLQNLRIQGKLKFKKVNGTVYYNRKEVMDLFN
jgi:hypothetical protein